MQALIIKDMIKKSQELDKYFIQTAELNSVAQITIETILNSEVDDYTGEIKQLPTNIAKKSIRCHIDETTKHDLQYFSAGLIPAGSYKLAIVPLDAQWFKLKKDNIDKKVKLNIILYMGINGRLEKLDGIYQPITIPRPNTNGSSYFVFINRQGE